MKSPYCLKKRKPQNVWYYKLQYEDTYHSTGEKTKAGADKYVISILTGERSQRVNVTVNEFTKSFFIRGECSWIENKELKGKTITPEMEKMRRGHLLNHFQPKFGKRKIESITSFEIEQWLIKLDLSNITKNHILDTVKIVWAEAKKRGEIKDNIVAELEKFSKQTVERDPFSKEELHLLFPENQKELIRIWGNEMFAGLFLLLATTGLRLGEALALTWKDIIYEKTSTKYVLDVNKSVKNDRRIGNTKNGENRIAFILPQLYSILEEWKKKTDFNSEEDFIFPNYENKPLQRKRCLVIFRKALEQTEIGTEKNLVPHSFRHTFNTMYRNVLEDEVLRKFTGHSDQKMTDHYDHQTAESTAMFLAKYEDDLEKVWNSISA